MNVVTDVRTTQRTCKRTSGRTRDVRVDGRVPTSGRTCEGIAALTRSLVTCAHTYENKVDSSRPYLIYVTRPHVWMWVGSLTAGQNKTITQLVLSRLESIHQSGSDQVQMQLPHGTIIISEFKSCKHVTGGSSARNTNWASKILLIFLDILSSCELDTAELFRNSRIFH